MRKFVSIVCLVVLLGVATPVQAQFRDAPTTQQASAKLYDTGSNPLFNKLFSPEHFRMSHSLEFSTGSFGGNGSSLGMYTNTMMWQFSSKLAARADVALAYSPDGGSNGGLNHNAFGNNSGRVFLRNAELAYRPNERTRIHLTFRQSPYGTYASPYGYGYGGSRFQASFGHGTGASCASPPDGTWQADDSHPLGDLQPCVSSLDGAC